jgi:hypothetical protein
MRGHSGGAQEATEAEEENPGGKEIKHGFKQPGVRDGDNRGQELEGANGKANHGGKNKECHKSKNDNSDQNADD